MYNLLIGGAAGQGIDTTSAILEKILKRAGYSVFTCRDFMSRIRGGHNFYLMRFGEKEVISHSYNLDGIIAMDEETINIHSNELKKDGFILCDTSIEIEDSRILKIAMEDIAKKLGNIRVSGSIAIGAVLKLFNEDYSNIEEVLQSFLDERYVDINLKAVKAGYDSIETRYPRLKGRFDDWMLLSGSNAIALGAIAAGIKFYSAYPMSPATPIMGYLATKGRDCGIVVEQAEDEIAAINMAIGASYAGARSMTATSGGGFSLMVEALGLSGMAEIPLVVVNMQRPGPATGLPTRTEQGDLKFMISASQGEFPRMVIAFRTHKDAFYQTVRAFNLAEKYQIPVILLGDQYLGDASATVEPFEINSIETDYSNYEYSDEYLRYKYTKSGVSPRLIPMKSKNLVTIDSDEHDEKGKITESAKVRVQMMDKRMKKLILIEQELQEPQFLGAVDYDILLIGWGSTYGPISEAIELLNSKKSKKYAALIFGDIFPLPQKLLIEKSKKAKQIINIEQNATGQLAGLIREYTGIICSKSILKYDGRQITGEEIVKRIKGGI
ncbi:MAG: 2-oxoacid:acceptor oxidoreductase subunit alpha [Clostridiaceae bacterium]|nr:2-oxoacid:acceptor oxidoreductase subunit alpha [Clostridiaceae bacterium]